MTAQRDVTDAAGIAWTCIAAYAGLGDGAEREAARIQGRQDAGGTGSRDVAVVCTPSGGARSVRLSLPPDWAGMDDDALLAAIAQHSGGR